MCVSVSGWQLWFFQDLIVHQGFFSLLEHVIFWAVCRKVQFNFECIPKKETFVWPRASRMQVFFLYPGTVAVVMEALLELLSRSDACLHPHRSVWCSRRTVRTCICACDAETLSNECTDLPNDLIRMSGCVDCSMLTLVEHQLSLLLFAGRSPVERWNNTNSYNC